MNGDNKLPGYPKYISSLGFPADVRKIDAALFNEDEQTAYYFVADKYWRYDLNSNAVFIVDATGYINIICKLISFQIINASGFSTVSWQGVPFSYLVEENEVQFISIENVSTGLCWGLNDMPIFVPMVVFRWQELPQIGGPAMCRNYCQSKWNVLGTVITKHVKNTRYIEDANLLSSMTQII